MMHAITATYRIQRLGKDKTPSSIPEPKGACKDLCFTSGSQNTGRQNTDVLAVSKLKSSRKPPKQPGTLATCYTHQPINFIVDL